METENKISIYDVLAGAYRGHGRRGAYENLEGRTLHSHAIVEGAETTLCRRIVADHLADIEVQGPPSCPVCATRYAKLTTKGIGR